MRTADRPLRERREEQARQEAEVREAVRRRHFQVTAEREALVEYEFVMSVLALKKLRDDGLLEL